MTANGTTHTTEEATVYVCDLDMFVDVQVLKEESTAELSLGKLCEDNGDPHEGHLGQPSYLIKNGVKLECKADNHTFLVVPGVQAVDHQTRADRRVSS